MVASEVRNITIIVSITEIQSVLMGQEREANAVLVKDQKHRSNYLQFDADSLAGISTSVSPCGCFGPLLWTILLSCFLLLMLILSPSLPFFCQLIEVNILARLSASKTTNIDQNLQSTTHHRSCLQPSLMKRRRGKEMLEREQRTDSDYTCNTPRQKIDSVWEKVT